MALEVLHNPFEHTHENLAFRELANQLKDWFDKKQLPGLLIGNPEIPADESLQPDILLFTPYSIFIIDLKNYGGKVHLPPVDQFPTRIWNCDGKQVRGGSFINPFAQLGSHRNKAMSVLKSIPKSEREYYSGLRPKHVVTLVYFHKPIQIKGSIPGSLEKTFFIADPNTILNFIEDVRSSALSLTSHHFNYFKRLFIGQPYNLSESFQETDDEPIENLSLWPEQNRILSEFGAFLDQEEERILILNGPECCGKSSLIPHLSSKAFEEGILQVEVLAPTGRIAGRLKKRLSLPYKSLYSFIYGGPQTQNEEGKDDEEGQEEGPELDLTAIETIPLRKDEDLESNAILIIDEAHLITNSFHKTEFLIFGSGHLLSDLLSFIRLPENKRKLVFIGDPYQLSFGKVEENALQVDFLRDLSELGVRAIKMTPNHNFISPSGRIDQNLKIAKGIDENSYCHLDFKPHAQVSCIAKQDIKVLVKSWIDLKTPFVILTFSNERAEEVNRWFRKNFLNQPEDLSPGDLLFINNNVRIPEGDLPFTEPRFVVNGTFMTVLEVGEETSFPKSGPHTGKLSFRKLKVKLSDSGQSVELWSLENYRNSLKAELSKDETIALKILLSGRIKKATLENPFEESVEYKNWESSSEKERLEGLIDQLKRDLADGQKVKGKLEEAEREFRKAERKARKAHRNRIRRQIQFNDPLINAAYLRFGWAMTVHKSLGEKWPEVLLNAEQGATFGKTNRSYFSWLYTGVSRSEEKINLINFQPIHPLMDLEVIEAIELITISEKPDPIKFKVNRQADLESEEVKFAEALEYAITDIPLIRCGHFIEQSLSTFGLNLKRVTHHNYQEVYQLSGNDEQSASIQIFYSGKFEFKSPNIIVASSAELKSALEDHLLNKAIPAYLWKQLTPSFKIPVYTKWKEEFKAMGWDLSVRGQHQFQDMLLLQKENAWISFKTIYNGDGFFQSVQATKSNQPERWKEVMPIFKFETSDVT